MKIVYPLLSAALIALVGCEKGADKAVYNCDSPDIQAKVTQSVGKRLLEEGVKGYSHAELSNLVSIVNSKTVERKSEYFKCKADLQLSLPADLGEKMGTAYSSIDGRRLLREKLEAKFGVINGPSAFNTVNALISDGSFGVVPTVPTAEQLKPLAVTISKNAQEIANAGTNIAFTYDVTASKDADGKITNEVNWYFDNYEILDVDVALISLAVVL